MQVPFNEPVILEESQTYLAEALRNRTLCGGGPLSKLTESLLSEMTGTTNLLVTSATHALEMMALLLNFGPDDEVIIPSFTFVSTANAFALRGAKIRFADVDETGNLIPSEVERLLNKKTKAVVTVHYAGGSADMNKLKELCKSAQVPLLEDAAQAIGAKFLDKPLGTIGSLGCFSFHDTKNVGCGEGGALLVNDSSFLERAEILREKGTNRRKFIHGHVDKYNWVDLGSSYIISELNAAFLVPQLKHIEAILQRRRNICAGYTEALESHFNRVGARVLKTPSYNVSNGHLWAAVFEKEADRDRFITHMKGRGVSTPFHYLSLHLSPFGLKLANGARERLVNCELLSGGLVRLPVYFGLTEKQQQHVIGSVLEFE